MSFIPFYFELVSVGILGLILGSFATALIARIPEGKPVFTSTSRSACMSCGCKLKARDLVPLFSWLFQRGKCRYCKARVSISYPLVEIASCTLCIGAFLLNKGDLNAYAPLVLASPILIALIVIDLKHKILPNVLVLILAGIGLLRLTMLLLAQDITIEALFTRYLSGALIYGVFAYVLGWVTSKVLNKTALGMGDVKFFAAAGLWLGISHLATFCILSGVLGVVLGLFWQKIKKEAVFPFGPALILAFITLLWFGGSHFAEKAVHYL